MNRGYFGIGIYHAKSTVNVGTLWRSAHNMGADFIFTIGRRYSKQPSDTTNAQKHIPLYEYDSMEDFKKHIPKGCRTVFVEQSDKSKDIRDFCHPERAVYILGAEDHGIPAKMMEGKQVVHINTPMCLNVAVAGSIVMYDRNVKINS